MAQWGLLKNVISQKQFDDEYILLLAREAAKRDKFGRPLAVAPEGEPDITDPDVLRFALLHLARTKDTARYYSQPDDLGKRGRPPKGKKK